jgi:hypothetical protein
MEGVHQLTLIIIDGKLSNNPKTSLQKIVSVEFVEGVVQFVTQHYSQGELSLTGYTTCKLILDDRKKTCMLRQNLELMVSGMISALLTGRALTKISHPHIRFL